MIVVNDQMGLTEYIESERLIISSYKGRVDHEASIAHLSAVIDFYKQHEVKAAIIDLREVFGSFFKIMEYLSDSFYPIALKSGLKAQAFVLTDDIIIKNLTKKLGIITSTFDVKSKTFATKEDAKKWLKD